MRSTQNPHVVNFAGAITISRDVIPAPCISPLKSGYVADIERIAASLNTLRPEAVDVKPFASMGEFAEIMAALIQDATPLTLAVAQK
jgi:CRISPR-associated protein Cst2